MDISFESDGVRRYNDLGAGSTDPLGSFLLEELEKLRVFAASEDAKITARSTIQFVLTLIANIESTVTSIDQLVLELEILTSWQNSAILGATVSANVTMDIILVVVAVAAVHRRL